MGKVLLLQGNEACAEAAIAAGVRFFGGYPITPSTEIAEVLAERLPLVGGRFIQMEDEIASISAVIGASLTGMKSMTATSGPGFSLMQESIGYAAMTETPCVIVNVQRVGPSTGSPTAPAQGDVMQVRWGSHGDRAVVAYCPWSVRETYEMTIEATNTAERLRIPTVLLLDEVVGHMRERFEFPDQPPQLINRTPPSVEPADFRPFAPLPGTDIPEMAAFGDGYRIHVTGLCHDDRGRPTGDAGIIERLIERCGNKAERRREELASSHCLGSEDPEVVIVAYGGTARSAARAVRLAEEEGRRVRLFRPRTIWPFPGEHLLAAVQDATTVVVAEMNLGQMRYEVERWLAGSRRVQGVCLVSGELLRPEAILRAIGGGSYAEVVD